MRFCVGLVLGLWLATAAAADEAALDHEFNQAVLQGTVGVEEMIKRLEAALPRLVAAEDSTLYFNDVFRAATKKAEPADLARLEKILLAIPPKSYCFEECFSADSTQQIRMRVAQLSNGPVHVEWKPTATEMPKELAGAPASFRDAWKLFRTTIEPFLEVLETDPATDGSLKKSRKLELDLRRVVGTPEPGAWRRLRAHEWGSSCGYGAEELYHPRNRALLISFLADGMLNEAAGAVLAQQPSAYAETPPQSLQIDLLSALGLDWEQVMFGSLLPVTGRNMLNHRPVISRMGECDVWRLLATRGSERVVRQCLELIRTTKLDPRDATEFLSLALGPEPVDTKPDDLDQLSIILPPIETIPPIARTAPLPIEVRRDILSVFTGYLEPTNDPYDLPHVLSGISKSTAKELNMPLRALLPHRARPVAAKALDILREAGLADGTEVIAPAPPPLRFRFLLNGAPLSAVEVDAEAAEKSDLNGEKRSATRLDSYVTVTGNSNSADGQARFSRAVADRQRLTSNQNGEISFSLEDCLEPERIAAIRFRLAPSVNGSEDLLSRLGLPERAQSAKLENEWPGPWFNREVDVSAGDDQVREVILQAADLEIKLQGFQGFPPETPIKICLQRAPSKNDPFPRQEGLVEITTRVGKSGWFRRLQAGKYVLEVTAPGAARYDVAEMVVNAGNVAHEARLEPGRIVKGVVVYPSGLRVELGYATSLFSGEAKLWRRGAETWEGVGFGRYTARVQSTREYEQDGKRLGYTPDKIDAEDRIEGRSVEFEIDASTPATLDLGEIVLLPEVP